VNKANKKAGAVGPRPYGRTYLRRDVVHDEVPLVDDGAGASSRERERQEAFPQPATHFLIGRGRGRIPGG
jgi:hypothetical protein